MSSGGAQGLCTKACEPVPTANDRARGHKQRYGGSASGASFVAASLVRLPPQPRLDSPGCGLSSAPTRGTRTRDGAELATSKAPTAAAPSPLLPAMGAASHMRCGMGRAHSRAAT